MNIAAVTPTRGDRGRLLEQRKLYVGRQSLPFTSHIIVDNPPLDQRKDITKRFREGITKAFAQGAELVFLIEDDDWYHPDYVRDMVHGWERAGKPKCFGVGYSYYYHLGTRAWLQMKHPERASAFSTMVTRDVLSMSWPGDHEPFFDIHLWKQLQGKTFQPASPIAVGVKHGIGMSGGIGHRKEWAMYKFKDSDMSWFRSHTGEDDFLFYKQLSDELINKR